MKMAAVKMATNENGNNESVVKKLSCYIKICLNFNCFLEQPNRCYFRMMFIMNYPRDIITFIHFIDSGDTLALLQQIPA